MIDSESPDMKAPEHALYIFPDTQPRAQLDLLEKDTTVQALVIVCKKLIAACMGDAKDTTNVRAAELFIVDTIRMKLTAAGYHEHGGEADPQKDLRRFARWRELTGYHPSLKADKFDIADENSIVLHLIRMIEEFRVQVPNLQNGRPSPSPNLLRLIR